MEMIPAHSFFFTIKPAMLLKETKILNKKRKYFCILINSKKERNNTKIKYFWILNLKEKNINKLNIYVFLKALMKMKRESLVYKIYKKNQTRSIRLKN